MPEVGERRAASGVLFGITVFLSAFLLFLVEPMIAKRILPWFGGATEVWITCLLFFQTALLAGYAYAHALAGCGARTQRVVHLTALAASLVVLPVAPGEHWKPAGGEDPSLRILALLAVTIGLPYVLLSSSSPLLQFWYGRRAGAGMPYRLFALSNLASMLALAAYPLVLEPLVGTRVQLVGWSAGYAAFVALCAYVSVSAGGVGRREARDRGQFPAPGAAERAMWLALSGCGSAMLLAATNQLTQNVAAIPFLWVLPLGLYLLSFILTFESDRWYRPQMAAAGAAAAVAGMAYGLAGIPNRGAAWIGVPVYAAGMFVCCYFCHGELARRKPAAGYLTSFYLTLSLGGALGGVFVSLVAPHLFAGFFEFPLTMMFCGALVVWVRRRSRVWVIGAAAAGLAVAVWYGGRDMLQVERRSRVMVRNFYGGLRVRDFDDGDDRMRELVHGTINHGMEFLDAGRSGMPITYYGPPTGVAKALKAKMSGHPEGIRVGVVGLGTGTLAAYGRAVDRYRFYEINPLVIGIARDWFTYLGRSRAAISIAIGDGRLSLEREEPQGFDVLAVDAFSSDSIPVHLLTREAMRVYRRQLKADGILALHISNANVNLRPVAAEMAASAGLRAWLVKSDDDDERELFATEWVLIPAAEAAGEEWMEGAKLLTASAGFRGWSDDFSNLFRVLK